MAKSGLKRQKSKTRTVLEEDGLYANGRQDSPNSSKRVRWDVTSDTLDDPPPSPQKEQVDLDISLSDKVMAVFCQSGRLGCAYYDPLKCVVYVLEDSREDTHYDLTKMLVEHNTPDIILTSSKSDDNFIAVLQDYAEAAGCIMQIRPHKEFFAARGRDRILSLKILAELGGETDHASDVSSAVSSGSGLRNAYDFMQKRAPKTGDPNINRWNAAIRLANFASVESAPLCLSSIGALIDFLTRERVAGELDHDGPEGPKIQSIEVLALHKVMHINVDALYSLQIFENENHASMHSDKTKEGLSLFGILNTTRTALGRSLLRTWLLRPSTSLEVIQARHDAVECFLLPENIAAAGALQTHLKGITNIPRTLGTLKSGKGTTNDWQALVKFTYHSSMLSDALSELYRCRNVEVVEKLIRVMDISRFKEIGNNINETVLFSHC